MRVNKTSKQNRSMMKGILYGALISFGCLFSGICVIATILIKGIATEPVALYIAQGVLLLSVLGGGLVAGKYTGQKYAVCCAINAGIVGLILIGIHIFAFPGKFNNVLLTVVILLVGGLASCFLCAKEKTKHRINLNR